MKTKRVILIIIIVCLTIVAGISVHERFYNPAPKVITQNRLDEIFKNNTNLSTSDKEILAGLFMSKIQETQLACALDEPVEHENSFFENIMAGLQKIDYEISSCEVSDDMAEINISINYFELQKIAQNAQEAFQNYLAENGSLSTDEMIEKLYELISNEFEKGPASDGRTSVTIYLYKKNHYWEMEDRFEDKILTAILQE